MNTAVVIDVFRHSRRSGPILNGSGPVLNGSGPVLNGSGPVLNESGPPDGSGSVRIGPDRSESVRIGPDRPKSVRIDSFRSHDVFVQFITRASDHLILLNVNLITVGSVHGSVWVRMDPDRSVWVRIGPDRSHDVI